MTSTRPPRNAPDHAVPGAATHRITTAATDPVGIQVVHRSRRPRPWWDTIMPPAMPTDLATPRSPDPRHPRARDPYSRRARAAMSATRC
ncbi:hypothetical protein BJY24_006978 [Nocardia transvalensis]|uniref:Uncharacterized protein n=1 Tax=Nocardia transvalensis TaxID=37333 RepID=A0A7W9PL54_9NOCA|nr:hypothetical protein [Nocardia transvalensis]MBB5918066.1 hypothetical protein [Nocardia transvalensis]